ncbi:MAG: hypothetical protein K5662_02265 [Lachnospiraceae bacterium]|nr:hypothetical protein [Lachnospiraceae bacterium]
MSKYKKIVSEGVAELLLLPGVILFMVYSVLNKRFILLICIILAFWEMIIDLKKAILLVVDILKGSEEKLVIMKKYEYVFTQNDAWPSTKTYRLFLEDSNSLCEELIFLDRSDKVLKEIGIGNKAKVEYFARSKVIKRIDKVDEVIE